LPVPLTIAFPAESQTFPAPFIAYGTTAGDGAVTATLASMDEKGVELDAEVYTDPTNGHWFAVFDPSGGPEIVGHRCKLTVAQKGSGKAAVANVRVKRPRRPARARGRRVSRQFFSGSISISSPGEGSTTARHSLLTVSGTVTGGQLSSATLTYQNATPSIQTIFSRVTNPWAVIFSSDATGNHDVSVTVTDTNSNADNVDFVLTD
jgi:hypothetical protein